MQFSWIRVFPPKGFLTSHFLPPCYAPKIHRNSRWLQGFGSSSASSPGATRSFYSGDAEISHGKRRRIEPKDPHIEVGNSWNLLEKRQTFDLLSRGKPLTPCLFFSVYDEFHPESGGNMETGGWLQCVSNTSGGYCWSQYLPKLKPTMAGQKKKGVFRHTTCPAFFDLR